MPQKIDTSALTVDEIQAGFDAGRLTAEALTRACLERIEAHNPRYNAIIFLNDNAIEEARAIDRRRAAGETLGPLAGIPVVVKDTMDMVGFPTTAGWHVLSARAGGTDIFPGRDCPVVARVKVAGCIILGKTNVPIFSTSGTNADDSWAGPTFNAVDPDFVPGGSTAGSATAVAGGFSILGLAEETGGSIQNPAAAQALVGVKPTFGLVPNVGVVPLGGSTLDVVGPLARTVREAALLLDILAGNSEEDPKTAAADGKTPDAGYAASLDVHAIKGARLGLYGPGWRGGNGGWRSSPMHEEIAGHYRRAQEEIAGIGGVCVADPFAGSGFAELAQTSGGHEDYDFRGMESFPQDLSSWLGRLGPGAAVNSWAGFVAMTEHEKPFSDGGIFGYMNRIAGYAENLRHVGDKPDLANFTAVRAHYLEVFNAVMDRLQLDALVFPQMLDPLPKRADGVSIRESTVAEINIAGLPVVTVPAGYLASGAPFNLAFIGRQWSEDRLLALAFAYEQATRHRVAAILQPSITPPSADVAIGPVPMAL